VIKLYFAPRTRSVRVLWLLEELGLPYELERVEFRAPAKDFFSQQTPLRKLPTIEDGDVVMCESGAIIEYILERYGDGRLAPAVGTPERAPYLQWFHFAESTAFPPVGIVVWLTLYRSDAALHPAIVEDARRRAASGLEFLEHSLGNKRYLSGAAFTAADVMMGFTLVACRVLGLLDDRYPSILSYLARLEERPAYQKAVSVE
jgi:glutathione S-transferase